ncbi:nuclear transport factor 2 family protein [Actinacidiphila acidipaludis]|uniref:Nuclear transport factor 2 family protein n=1 Tax=Actinacidiphila acidipaludis TaxID=2873382 RepID=A0ABS7QIB7_9ACTN|nr:nuclear transport factor 2 family protein [Streptomyces acidipaludis]MBY8882913.1 nuclear transport factor 2 family protein [Streptomyces acidipaludis]
MTDSSPTPVDRDALPDVISRYLTAHNAGDGQASAALMTADAQVTDDGRTYDGLPDIQRWLNRAASEYTYTTTYRGAVRDAADHWTITQRLDGNFPGGTVDLRYAFTLDGDLISRLVIAP